MLFRRISNHSSELRVRIFNRIKVKTIISILITCNFTTVHVMVACFFLKLFSVDRLENLSIQFGDTQTPPEIKFFRGVLPEHYYIRFDTPYTGRYLRLFMSKREYLTICELELYGRNRINQFFYSHANLLMLSWQVLS